jgi:cell division protein FtsI (penicillin-binding protein 3)
MKLSDRVHCNGGSIVVQGRKISEAESHEKFEWLSLDQIIQVSSNVGAAKLALKVGADPFQKTLDSLGFGSRTGIGFPGEIVGKLPSKKPWQPLTLANVGFGQGILVTPLQMLRAYAVFANGGWLVQPRLLKDDREEARLAAPQRVLTPAQAEAVTQALRMVTQSPGTGLKAVPEGYTVAGKTGTAQMVEPGTGRYSRSNYVASFIGYPVGTASADARFVIFTALHAPRGVYYASETAAPLFRNVLKIVANRFSLPTHLDSRAPEKTLAAGKARPRNDEVQTQSAHPVPIAMQRAKAAQLEAAPTVQPVQLLPVSPVSGQASGEEVQMVYRVPSFQGLSAREVLRTLNGHRFRLEIRGTGLVRSQFPEAGQTLADDGQIRLELGE